MTDTSELDREILACVKALSVHVSRNSAFHAAWFDTSRSEPADTMTRLANLALRRWPPKEERAHREKAVIEAATLLIDSWAWSTNSHVGPKARALHDAVAALRELPPEEE